MGAGSIPATTESDIPDEILQACFARLPLRCVGKVKAVCKRWQRLSDAAYLYLLRKSMGLTQPCAYMLSSKYEQGRYAGLQIITGGEFSQVSDTQAAMANDHMISAGDLINRRSVSLLKLGSPRLQFSATAAVDGRLLYILGGRSPLISAQPDTWVVFRRVDVYDTVLNRWLHAKPMQTARYAFAVGALRCGAEGRPGLMVAGGYDTHGHPLASAELYDAASDEWHSLPGMTFISGACKGRFTRGKFYVKMANNGPLAVEAFDPALCLWTRPFSHRTVSHLDSTCNQECVPAQELIAFHTTPGVIVFDL